MQTNRSIYRNTWHLQEYLCDYFQLNRDEFTCLQKEKRTTIDDNAEQIQDIIAILKTATYTPCDIEADDYEYVELLFFSNDQSIRARVIFAYRYSNRCMYAFYKDKCYQLQNYDTAKDCLGRLTCLPENYHVIDAIAGLFFYDRFFYDKLYYNAYEDDYIYDGFINTVPTKITTKEDAQKLAIKEISDRIEIIWPPEFEFFPEYKEIRAERMYYDKFSGNWLAEVLLYYPIDTNEETVNGSPGKSADFIFVYLNSDGCTQMIWDPFELLSSKLVPWLK